MTSAPMHGVNSVCQLQHQAAHLPVHTTTSKGVVEATGFKNNRPEGQGSWDGHAGGVGRFIFWASTDSPQTWKAGWIGLFLFYISFSVKEH